MKQQLEDRIELPATNLRQTIEVGGLTAKLFSGITARGFAAEVSLYIGNRLFREDAYVFRPRSTPKPGEVAPEVVEDVNKFFQCLRRGWVPDRQENKDAGFAGIKWREN